MTSQMCNIPFNYQNNEKYFCSLISGKYQCEVGEIGSETYDECTRGLYLSNIKVSYQHLFI